METNLWIYIIIAAVVIIIILFLLSSRRQVAAYFTPRVITKTQPRLEMKTAAFIREAARNPPIYTISPAKARAMVDSLATIDTRSLTLQQDYQVTYKGFPLSFTIFSPRTSGICLPAKGLILYIHGGGWVVGSKRTHALLVSRIANATGRAVVLFNYELSPEVQFPYTINSCYAMAVYLSKYADRYYLDAEDLIVMGDSVGGQMAASLCIMAKKRGFPKISRQILMYPVTSAMMNTDSYHEFQDGPWLTRRAMEYFFDMYAPNPRDRVSYMISPLNAGLTELAGLPPALIITDENDVLRDEGEAYARKLSKAGVQVISARFMGTIHDFTWLEPLSETPAAQGAIALIAGVVKEN